MRKIIVTIKKNSKYEGGANAVKKKKTVYTRENTSTKEVTPGSKGKLFIKEGTVQRTSPTGVKFVADDDKSIRNSSNKIIDPKSGKTESSGQASLRKATIDSHQGVDLSKRYKEGDTVTYDTKKGKQVAGKIQKSADTPPEYRTITTKQVLVSKKGDVKDSGGKSSVGKQLKSEGYTNQQGTYKYIKADENKWVNEDEVDAHEKAGYFRSDRAKNKLEKKALGVKKMKVFKKGSKMC